MKVCNICRTEYGVDSIVNLVGTSDTKQYDLCWKHYRQIEELLSYLGYNIQTVWQIKDKQLTRMTGEKNE